MNSRTAKRKEPTKQSHNGKLAQLKAARNIHPIPYTMDSFIHLVSADIVRGVKVDIPGHKLTQSDRFGDGDDKLQHRVSHAKNAVMKTYLSAEVCERDQGLNYGPWKELFMLELDNVPATILVKSRQLALDLGISNVEELFASEVGDVDVGDLETVMTKLSPGTDQVRAFLAAKDVLGQLLSDKMCKWCSLLCV